jgi:hypothetical protein
MFKKILSALFPVKSETPPPNNSKQVNMILVKPTHVDDAILTETKDTIEFYFNALVNKYKKGKSQPSVSEYKKFEDSMLQLISTGFIMLKDTKNVLEEYRSVASKLIDDLKKTDEYTSSGDKDRVSLEDECLIKAHSLTISKADTDTARINTSDARLYFNLTEESLIKVNKMIAKYGVNILIKVTEVFLGYGENKRLKIIRKVSPSDYDYKLACELTSEGHCRRGKDIPAHFFLSELKVAELKEIATKLNINVKGDKESIIEALKVSSENDLVDEIEQKLALRDFFLSKIIQEEGEDFRLIAKYLKFCETLHDVFMSRFCKIEEDLAEQVFNSED